MSRSPDPQAHLYDDLVSGDGEQAARELLPLVKKFVCKKVAGLAPEADDIARETFERVCEKIHTFQGTSRFSTWVCGIARNVLCERLRDQKKQSLLDELTDDFEADGTDPEQQLIEQTTREINGLLVEEALQTLTDRQRRVYQLKHTTELTSAEIGEQLGMSAGAVRSAFADANTRIERWRKDKGYSQ